MPDTKNAKQAQEQCYRAIAPAYERFGLIKAALSAFPSCDEPGTATISFDPRVHADALYALQYGFDGWERQINAYGTVFVPSAWQGERLSSLWNTRASIELRTPVVDVARIPTMRRRRGKKLRFLFLASHADQPRKGVDLAKASFTAAFGHREDVELVIHSTYPAPMLTINAPNINIAGGTLYGDDYAEYLHGFDALLHPARAEVYGMTVLEAIASGMPAIHTGATGLEAFADLSLTCAHRSVRCKDGTEWREPYLDHLVDRMREVDTKYDVVTKRALRDAKVIHDLHNAEVSNDGATHEPANVSHA